MIQDISVNNMLTNAHIYIPVYKTISIRKVKDGKANFATQNMVMFLKDSQFFNGLE